MTRVRVHSYLRPPPALGAGCRGSADRAGQQRKPSALQQRHSPPHPSPQSQYCDLQGEGGRERKEAQQQIRKVTLFLKLVL